MLVDLDNFERIIKLLYLSAKPLIPFRKKIAAFSNNFMSLILVVNDLLTTLDLF